MSLNSEFYAPVNYEANVPRAYHNLSEKNSFTPYTGLAMPVYTRMCYAGDDFEINTGTLLQSIVPMNRPLLDCFELRLEYYFEPLRNLYGYMSNNSKESADDIVENSPKWMIELFGDDGILGLGQDEQNYYLPTDVFGSLDKSVQKNSLAEHFGIPVGWQGNLYTGYSYPIEGEPLPENSLYTGRFAMLGNIVNIEPWLVYLDIMRTYHVNTQLPNAYFMKGLSDIDDSTGTSESFDIEALFTETSVSFLDDLFVSLRYISRHRDFQSMLTSSDLLSPNTVTGFLAGWIKNSCRLAGGFFPVQYKPDMWRNLLSKTEYKTTTVSASGGVVSIEEFRTKNKVQRFRDAVLLSGGRFSNLMRTVFGWRSDLDLDIPVLRHVTKHLIDPSNITAMATTQTSEGETTLGQKGSNVDRYNGSKTVRIKCDEPGYIMVIASITPIVSYSQGFNPFLLRLSHNDDWNPNFANLGFQSIPRIFYSAYPDLPNGVNGDGTVDDEIVATNFSAIVGKNLAWIEERTAVSHVHGDFNEWNGQYRDMVLGRKYTNSWHADNLYYQQFQLDTYVNPLAFNDIFAIDNILDAPWSLHCAFNIKAKRPIGKHYRPNLE